jgi:hypothetical protein
VAKFRFEDRVVDLDPRAERFLKTAAWLGGYFTAEQAQLLGMRNSVPRVHAQLKDLEAWGFLNRVSTYPAVYQISKSVTRLLGRDLSARRRHAVETIRTRLLTANFYLEAVRWPVEFVFDHQEKTTELRQLGCDLAMLPQRAGKPYLWEDLMLRGPSGELTVAVVDHYGRNAYRRLHRVLKRFGRCLASAPEDLKILVVVASERRHRLFARLLHQSSLQRLLPEASHDSRPAVTIYRVRRAVPVVRSLIPNHRSLRDLWASRKPGRSEYGNHPPQLVEAVDDSSGHDMWQAKGGLSC